MIGAEAAKIEIEEKFDNEIGYYLEGFVIDNDLKAEWALKKITANNAKYERISAVCQENIGFYQRQDETAKQKRDTDNNSLISMLFQYFENIEPQKTKTQATYKLPSGKLVKKFEKQELKHDDTVLIESLKDTEYVENVPKLKWGEYKKTLSITEGRAINGDGEIVDGVTVEVKPASFNVEV